MSRTKRAALQKARESNIKKPKTESEKAETRQVEISCSSTDQNDFEGLDLSVYLSLVPLPTNLN